MKYCPLLQLFSMIKSEDGIKHRDDFFWSVGDFSFEKVTIGHIFTGQYYGLHWSLQTPFDSFILEGIRARSNLFDTYRKFHKESMQKKIKIFVWLFAIFQQHCGHYVLLREVEKSAKHSKLDKYMWSLFPYFILLAEKTIQIQLLTFNMSVVRVLVNSVWFRTEDPVKYIHKKVKKLHTIYCNEQ